MLMQLSDFFAVTKMQISAVGAKRSQCVTDTLTEFAKDSWYHALTFQVPVRTQYLFLHIFS